MRIESLPDSSLPKPSERSGLPAEQKTTGTSLSKLSDISSAQQGLNTEFTGPGLHGIVVRTTSQSNERPIEGARGEVVVTPPATSIVSPRGTECAVVTAAIGDSQISADSGERVINGSIVSQPEDESKEPPPAGGVVNPPPIEPPTPPSGAAEMPEPEEEAQRRDNPLEGNASQVSQTAEVLERFFRSDWEQSAALGTELYEISGATVEVDYMDTDRPYVTVSYELSTPQEVIFGFSVTRSEEGAISLVNNFREAETKGEGHGTAMLSRLEQSLQHVATEMGNTVNVVFVDADQRVGNWLIGNDYSVSSTASGDKEYSKVIEPQLEIPELASEIVIDHEEEQIGLDLQQAAQENYVLQGNAGNTFRSISEPEFVRKGIDIISEISGKEVADMGSGYGGIAQTAFHEGIDTKITSINPTLRSPDEHEYLQEDSAYYLRMRYPDITDEQIAAALRYHDQNLSTNFAHDLRDHPAGKFNLILDIHAVHEYMNEEFDALYQRTIEEMFRVLAPGGYILVIDGTPHAVGNRSETGEMGMKEKVLRRMGVRYVPLIGDPTNESRSAIGVKIFK